MKEIGERYVPAMNVDPIFRADRFGRGGDHTAFNLEGFPAVRLSSPEENFANQHSVTDTFANTSRAVHRAWVTKVNGAVAASLAWAPKSPETSEQVRSAMGAKLPALLLTRGKSRYDADAEMESRKSPSRIWRVTSCVMRRPPTLTGIMKCTSAT